jgi:hypothetical protein
LLVVLCCFHLSNPATYISLIKSDNKVNTMSPSSDQQNSTGKSSTLLPQKRKKAQVPARLRWAATGLQTVIQASAADDSSSSTATLPQQQETLPVTDVALHALVLCHERFLQVVASELMESMKPDGQDDEEDSKRVAYVKPAHVLQTMNVLGFSHLVPPAQAAVGKQQAIEKKSKECRKKRNKKVFSAAEVAEQERMLAQSKVKATSSQQQQGK